MRVVSRRAVDLADALRALHEVVEPQLHTLRRRHEASAARDGVRFRIGQVVAHKRYGYRGVIYGWDPRPAVDVSRWDGVVGLPRRGEQPFYPLLPDAHDSAAAFGAPRHPRYVAEDNLEPSRLRRTDRRARARQRRRAARAPAAERRPRRPLSRLAGARRVAHAHDSIPLVFDAWHPSVGRYCRRAAVAQFPADVEDGEIERWREADAAPRRPTTSRPRPRA